MARFIILAMPASFIHCDGGPSGAYDMVSVPVMSPPLLRLVVEAKNLDQLRDMFAEAKADMIAHAKPFSLSARLVTGDRAPRGWNDAKYRFRFDESFGIYEN